MNEKLIYELGKMAQQGNEDAMLEIIKRKTPLLKKYSCNDEDLYQYLIWQVIEAIKKYEF